jgi:pyruvate dehydrogenase E1 component alpha subunit
VKLIENEKEVIMFETYNPIDDKLYKVIDNAGKVVLKGWNNTLTDKELIQAYRDMLFERTADTMAVNFQRQGRMGTYPPNLGQEAIHIASAKVIAKDDWVVPAFRELGVYLAAGASLMEIFWYYKGNENASKFTGAPHLLPISVPIATQLLHASGLGFSLKYKKEKGVVFAYVGDGGTSEGDFHEALNFAAVWQAPVIFIIQNNQYAISMPVRQQTRSINMAVKGIAYGIPSVKADGNDFLAMYDVLSYAKKQASAGKGPFLVEALTFRRGAHTTSDDPTRYRTKEEENTWLTGDPLNRFKSFLNKKGLLKSLDEKSLEEEYKLKITKEFEAAEAAPEYKPDEVFATMFEQMPDELKRQKHAYESYLAGKERQK